MTQPSQSSVSNAQPLRLRTSPASPFGRKVRMSAAAIGLADRLKIEPADTADPQDSLRQQNPLGKIPVLLLDDGQALYDSRVIVEFLNDQDGRSILIPSGEGRYAALIQQVLADGILDAAILQVYEGRYRPEHKHEQSWLDYQRGKVDRALEAFGKQLPAPGEGGPHIGEIALAAALGYLDFRFQGYWRDAHPGLVDWLDAFGQRFPAYEATAPDAK